MVDPAALARRVEKLTSILEVSKALAAERRLEALLARVVDAGAHVAEAERCTIFVVDRDRGELWSKVALGAEEIRIPLSTGLAGAVATSGASLRVADAHADPRFNPAVDRATGYRTRSVLAVPMVNTRGEVVGVLQALNHRGAGVFGPEEEELLGALAGPAASALENAVLNEEIERLFEGFVQASVVAIEQRDPTTAGHSGRVATLTVSLARAAERAAPAGSGPRFDAADLQQLRYAALLHDFGKVGVRERVLVKADKLYPHELSLVAARFELARLALENHALRARLGGDEGAAGALLGRAREVDGLWQVVVAANRPSVLAEDAPARLAAAAALTYPGPDGEAPLLTPGELHALSIPRGSLTEEERREIEAHVTHTYRFLAQIPWTRGLRRVPEIAYAHHEKLDGHGYPRGAPGEAIPVEARMMTIADIYDALTASDRPYKKALPAERALSILADEAQRGQLDGGLLRVFVEAKVWKGAAPA